MNTDRQYTIGIVGRGFGETVDKLKVLGYKAVLFHDSRLPESSIKNFDRIYSLDFNSMESLKRSLENVNIKVDALISIYENYIYPKAMLCEILGLRGPSLDSAFAITDKFLQRQMFLKSDPTITPKFKLVEKVEDLNDIQYTLSFPVILKPTNLMKSLLVNKCNNISELRENFKSNNKAIRRIYEDEGVNREPKFIVEEFLKGTGHSIELFVDHMGRVNTPGFVVDVVKANEIGVEDNYEYVRIIPSKLSNEKTNEIIAVATKGIKALGIKNTTGHAEIIYTVQGPKIIEINGRIGGYRERMYRYSFGMELTENEVKLYLGETPVFIPSKMAYTAVFELFPDHGGRLIEITNIDKVKQLDSFKYFSSAKVKGDTLGLSKEGFRSAGIIIINNPNKSAFYQDLHFIQNNVKINVM